MGQTLLDRTEIMITAAIGEDPTRFLNYLIFDDLIFDGTGRSRPLKVSAITLLPMKHMKRRSCGFA
jgi:hypothetical protein